MLAINILICFLAKREGYRKVIFSPQEIFCGPDCETTRNGEIFHTIKTPPGMYDISSILDLIPRSQQPDLVVVKADATRRNFPINLGSLKCPKLLICGNTQHLAEPIQTLVEYAIQQQFDFIMSDHKRHHLHYFREAGFKNVFWIPGFNVNPHPQTPRLNPRYLLTFVGQVGRFHPYRKYILGYLKKCCLPLNEIQALQEKAAEIYTDSLINLNISLNGDLNLRVFEVLSSGGFLLTDKLSKQSGLDLIFQEGKHLVSFKNEAELKYKIDYFLKNPDASKEIAQKGNEEFWKNHRPELNIQRVLDYIDGKNIEPIYKIEADKRSIYVTSQNIEELSARILVYEYLQELHLNQASLKILFWENADPRIICDAVDLPRLNIHLLSDSTKNSNLFIESGVLEQITLTSSQELDKFTTKWDLITLTWAELKVFGLDNLLDQVNFYRLLVIDTDNNIEEADQQILDNQLDRRGFVKESDRPLAYIWKQKSDWGNLLLSQQQFLKSVRAFELALQDNPFDVNARFELAMLAFKLDRLDEAEKQLRQVVSLNRRHSLGLEYFVRVLMAQNKYLESKDILEYLVSLNPTDASLWSLLETCYEQIGLEEKSWQAYNYYRDLRSGVMSVDTQIKQSSAKSELKRILVINNLYPPQELGGYGRYICDFANILHSRGHTVEVLTSNAPYLGEIAAPENNIDRSLLLYGSYEKLPPQAFEDISEINYIFEYNNKIITEKIQTYRPDVCLVGNIDLLSHNLFIPILDHQIPTIHHVAFKQPGYLADDTPVSPFYHLSACSEFVKKTILETGYPLEDISVIFPGAVVDTFRMPIAPNLEKLRIVYASLVAPYKGPQTLVEALGILHNENVDFHCSIAGKATDEKFLEHLKNFTKGRGMSHKIDFLGYLTRPQLLNLYATHNIFIFPSVWEEPFGISQVEGMAAGLLLITSGTGGAAEVIEPEVSGLTFLAGDSTGLADALMSLSHNREGWHRMAVTGQERAVMHLDIEHSVDMLEEKFEELLQQREHDEQFLSIRLAQQQTELRENLNLREINFVIFPDWAESEELLSLDLVKTIRAVATHPHKNQITLLIDTRNISEEDAELALSGVVMNLFMEEDLDVTEGPEISLIGTLSSRYWAALLPLLDARIMIEHENLQAISAVGAEGLLIQNIENLK